MTGVLTGKEEEDADNTRMEGWRGDHMRTQGEGGRLQAREREALGGNCWHYDLGLPELSEQNVCCLSPLSLWDFVLVVAAE